MRSHSFANLFAMQATAGLRVATSELFATNNSFVAAVAAATPKQPTVFVGACTVQDEQSPEPLTRYVFGLGMGGSILSHVNASLLGVGHATGRLQRRGGASIGCYRSIVAQIRGFFNIRLGHQSGYGQAAWGHSKGRVDPQTVLAVLGVV